MNIKKIKEKIMLYDQKKWWGDDYDVRFYLISKLKRLTNKSILDLGGGIGIISSELNSTNFRINLDISLEDLKISKKVDSHIHQICASMTNLPFLKESFDCVVCSNLLEVGKAIDLENNAVIKEGKINQYPTIERIFLEISRMLKNNGIMYLSTPNNEYYQSNKLDYDELKNSLNSHFPKFSLYFFNTFPRLSRKYRKLNLANIIPKMISKLKSDDGLLKILLKNDDGKSRESVSFYVEAFKKENKINKE